MEFRQIWSHCSCTPSYLKARKMLWKVAKNFWCKKCSEFQTSLSSAYNAANYASLNEPLQWVAKKISHWSVLTFGAVSTFVGTLILSVGHSLKMHFERATFSPNALTGSTKICSEYDGSSYVIELWLLYLGIRKTQRFSAQTCLPT